MVVGGQRHDPAALYPLERPGTHCTGSWMGPRAGLDGAENLFPPRDSIPDRPARSQSLYRLSYRAHTSIFPSVFTSITCFRWQHLRKMWPIHLLFFRFIVCSIFLFSWTLRSTSSFLTQSVQIIFTGPSPTHFQNFSRWFWYTLRSVQISALYKTMILM